MSVDMGSFRSFYNQSKFTAESDQTVTLGGVLLFFNKWRISDMGLQTISSLIANLSCHQQHCK